MVTAGTPVQVWPGLAYGLGLLMIMEASYDHLTILRGRAAGRRYAVRRTYLARVGVGTVLAGFLVAVLGVGVRSATRGPDGAGESSGSAA